jgi:hypothetical protein
VLSILQQIDLITAVLRWADAQLKARDLASSPSLLKEIVPHLRFPLLYALGREF